MYEARRLRCRDRHGREFATGVIRTGRGEAVVLVHGVGARSSIWQPQIAALGERFDVIAYDMWGHGAASLPPAGVTLGDYTDQLLAVIDHLALPRCHVIGHSMGALVGLEFALSHPGRAASVAALNAVFCRSADQRSAVEARAAAVRRETPIRWDATIARWFGDPVPEPWRGIADSVREMLGAVDPVGYARAYQVFATSDGVHRERLATLRIPALFLTGELDPNSLPAMSQAMADLAPRGRAAALAGERHLMTLTAAADVNRRLLAFLDSAALDLRRCAS